MCYGNSGFLVDFVLSWFWVFVLTFCLCVLMVCLGFGVCDFGIGGL